MTKKLPKINRTHGQIAAALKKEAKNEGRNPNDVYNQFFRETFLRELMLRENGWVLKGGSNIYCRIPGARHTRDLDLYRQSDPTSAAEAADALVGSMDGHKVGPYTFLLRRPDRKGKTGAIDSERVEVSVTYGINSQLIQFSVDVSGDLEVTGTAEPLTVQTSYGIETTFLPSSFRVYSYPVANQLADKVCAMYERHGATPPGRTSTRYRDLYDIALIASELPVTAVDLRDAIRTQCRVRSMTLPASIVPPDEAWEARYTAHAKKFTGVRESLRDFHEAMRLAGLLLDPILRDDPSVATGRWDPASLAWR
ncbi:nucleotidyl transferase AbiEii/AbiGii toxin family protein [Corynebacterium sp.]|uniref:nucleotidyl transferase AbiEii/AbiGii toxin family protein n=1 Tax=Corynebacterium sp. TaxID=1720 RepID=UPI002A910369|nr:nucleotidyl transferase AbiEii/AbiGii toxin family protein [Corynebacterium sp.]MDY5784664.1 nucleotidyl transferase AbiEii/AbiGii toxin family protein [Corynebacterium sp.]